MRWFIYKQPSRTLQRRMYYTAGCQESKLLKAAKTPGHKDTKTMVEFE